MLRQSQAINCDNRFCGQAADARKETVETDKIIARMADLGVSQIDLALAIGMTPDKVSKALSGVRQWKGPELVRVIQFLENKAAGIDADIPPTRLALAGDGAVALRKINLGFAMGDGSNLDDYFEEETFDFDANLLHTISSSPPHRLVVASGIGDSMFPTIMDNDIIIIDLLQTELNKADRIWAISHNGFGGIKRLAPAGRDLIEIISDNPVVPNRVAALEELRIIGRVVWSGRRH